MSASFNTFQTYSDNKFMVNEFWNNVNGTLKICQLAQKDEDPFRLAEYLRPNQKESPINPAGLVTLSQIIRIMRLTPFMNPQISSWIKSIYCFFIIKKILNRFCNLFN